MKRLVSFLLVLSLLLSISVVSFADNNVEKTISVQSRAPSDFHFDHTETGSTKVDVLTSSLVALTVTALFSPIPGATAVSVIISVSQILAEYYSTQQTLSGDYIRYVYVPDNRGDYPACESWVYIEYYADIDQDSYKELVGTDSYYNTIVLPK